MKKFLTLLLISFSIVGLSQSGFKAPFASKENLYFKSYNNTDNSPSFLFKGDVVNVNNLSLDESLNDKSKLSIIEEITQPGNYVFDGKKWRAAGKNLARQTRYLSFTNQSISSTGTAQNKVIFSLAKDKLFENVTRFHEATNEFEILYTGFHEVSGSIGFNAFRNDLIAPNFVTINVQILNGNTPISSFQQTIVGKEASEWVSIQVPPKKLKLNSGDKISLVISRVSTKINNVYSQNLGNGDHIGCGNLPQQFSKSIIIEKL